MAADKLNGGAARLLEATAQGKVAQSMNVPERLFVAGGDGHTGRSYDAVIHPLPRAATTDTPLELFGLPDKLTLDRIREEHANSPDSDDQSQASDAMAPAGSQQRSPGITLANQTARSQESILAEEDPFGQLKRLRRHLRDANERINYLSNELDRLERAQDNVSSVLLFSCGLGIVGIIFGLAALKR